MLCRYSQVACVSKCILSASALEQRLELGVLGVRLRLLLRLP